MKGLLLQDYYIMKRNLLITGGVCLYMFIILMLGSHDASDSETDLVLYVILGLVTCFLTSCSYLTIDNNRKKKISLFIRSCPVTNRQIILEKYLLTYLLILSGTLIVNLFAVINHFVSGYMPTRNFMLTQFIILSVILIFTHMELPVTIRFGQAVASGILIAFICVVILAGIMVVIKISLSDSLSYRVARFHDNRLYLVVILLMLDIGTGFLSYTASKFAQAD